MSADVSDRLADLGGTHHGRLPAEQPRAAGTHEHAPRARAKVRFVLDRMQVRRVIEGDKTRHVRLWKDTDPDVGPCQVNDRVPVQKKGAGVVCHVIVSDVDIVLLSDIGLDEARALGYRTSRGFQREWLIEHDRRWTRFTEEQLLERETVDKIDAGHLVDADEASDHDVGEAFTEYADLSVWIFTFAVDLLEGHRYLAPASGRETAAGAATDSARGYTTNAARSPDPDAPAASNLDLERMSFDAERRLKAFKRELTEEQLEERESGDDKLIQRFTQTVALARAKGIDPHSQIRLVGRALGQLETAIRGRHAEQKDQA